LVLAWHRHVWALVGLAALMVGSVAIGLVSWQANEERRALWDAASPATSAERLHQLVHFDRISGFPSVLDDRLAANHNTPPETLRELAQRVDINSSRTRYLLAKNPRTPEDVRARMLVR